MSVPQVVTTPRTERVWDYNKSLDLARALPVDHPGLDHDASLKPAAPDLAELLGTVVIEIQHPDVLEQVGDFLNQWTWVADVVRPGVKLTQDDGRNEQATTVLDESMRAHPDGENEPSRCWCRAGGSFVIHLRPPLQLPILVNLRHDGVQFRVVHPTAR